MCQKNSLEASQKKPSQYVLEELGCICMHWRKSMEEGRGLGGEKWVKSQILKPSPSLLLDPTFDVFPRYHLLQRRNYDPPFALNTHCSPSSFFRVNKLPCI